MLKNDIKQIEWYLGERMSHTEIVDEWTRIKKFIEEAQNTSTNNAMVPCPKHDSGLTCPFNLRTHCDSIQCQLSAQHQ
jgi:hypothetical protein